MTRSSRFGKSLRKESPIDLTYVKADEHILVTKSRQAGSRRNTGGGIEDYERLDSVHDACRNVFSIFTRPDLRRFRSPSEPRKQIPLEVIVQLLEDLDPSIFWEAQFGFFLLSLLFTFSRSECPCPKAFTGPESFDEGKHWQVKDIRFIVIELMKGFKWRFKSVKQDPRIERPQAHGGEDGEPGDWAYVGDIPDSIFSLSRWYSALMAHYGAPRDPEDPFFMAQDRTRPYTYRCAMADMERMLARIGCTERYGLHSLRVAGYNLSKNANGEALTVAHGLWLSSAHTRYERFGMRAVLAMAANMVREADPHARPAEVAEREMPAARSAVSRRSAALASTETVEASAPRDLLPDGYAAVAHEAPSGRTWHTFVAPDGTSLRSRVECWRHADEGASASGRPPRSTPRFTPRRRAQVVPVGEADSDAADEPADTAATPVASASQVCEPCEAPLAQTSAVPLYRRFDIVEMDHSQCGNPDCLVPSVNGRHLGEHRFRPPQPRRRRA